MSAKATASGHAVKHTKTSKAAKKTAKHRPNHHKLPATHKATGHKVTAKATHAKHAKAVGFGVGDLLPVCAFEAVAQSLRLLGQPVSDDDVCGLWHLLGEPDEGVPVGEALAAAALFGLGGVRPVPYPVHGIADVFRGEYLGRTEGLSRVAFPQLGVHLCEMALDEGVSQVSGHGPNLQLSGLKLGSSLPGFNGTCILAVDVPGPHAVLATPDGWWSWGELHDPWPCRVSEAWAVSWS